MINYDTMTKPLLSAAFILSSSLLLGCCSKNGGETNGPGATCAIACHGDATTEAPPADTQGNTETTASGVGAHRAHLDQGTLGRAVPCEECHTVPKTATDTGHDDTDPPADVTFTGVSITRMEMPDYDGTKCNNTYCHNPTSKDGTMYPMGGKNNSPEWTKVDGTQNACESCHALPPPYDEDSGKGHTPTMQACSACHPNIDKDNMFADPSTHVDGTVDLN